MVDKFGSSREKRIILSKIRQDLDMRDHRITNLGTPESSSDAVTRRWVNQQFKNSAGEIDELKTKIHQMMMELKRIREKYDDSIKGLEKDVQGKVGKKECVSTNGGKMNVDLDMQGHAIRNLPEGKEADEPVTKGWYAKNWQELVATMQDKIDAAGKKYDTLETQMFDNQDRIDSIETFVNLKHPAGGSTSSRRTARRTTTNKEKIVVGNIAPTTNEDEIVVDGIVPLTNQ